MMDCTDKYCRYFHRILTRKSLLYTEMVVARTIIEAEKRGDIDKYLAFDPFEKPLVLQIGGSDPEQLYEAARIAAKYDYDELNLNVGCPSDRVQSGKFGVCLMREPELVAECMAALKKAVNVPVSVKTRIGVDNDDDEEFLASFIQTVASSGTTNFIIHARKAWLKGLNPAQNRNIPKLNYDRVFQMKTRFPKLKIEINGGIKILDDCLYPLEILDGVMIGRAAYEDPWILSQVDSKIFGGIDPCSSREEVLLKLKPLCEQIQKCNSSLHHLARHISGLYKGQPKAKKWRIKIQELLKLNPQPVDFLQQSLTVFNS